MSTIATIAAGDQITDSRTVINTNFSNLNTDKIETSTIDTDTSLTANSDAKIPSQKAVKAYVDTGGNVNASTTAKGIVEEATQAEVDSGSAAGGTSARLFINPSTLLTSRMSGVRTVTAGATINGATLPVPVYQNKTDNEFYACDGNDTAAMKFLGFAVSNGTDGATFNVQFTGIVSGFTGLDEGEKYYLSDTVGTISTTIGTYEVLVGVAISTTELLIQKGRRNMTGAGSQADAGADETTTNVAITLGFRPSVIRMTAVPGISASNFGLSQGTWRNGTYATAYLVEDAGGTAQKGTNTSYIANMYTATTEHWQVTVTNVTDTGFTFSFLQKDASPLTLYYVWEAEGEL